MKIRTRSRLILIGTIVVFLLALSYITQSVIIESFGAIERQEATANMQRVLSSMNDQVEQVAAQCRGRAEWDDTYRFIDDKNPGYIQSNLASPTTFTNLGINYMLFYNVSGSLVYAKGYDIENGAELPITGDLTALVKNSIIPEGMPGGVSGRRGFSLLDGQPVIIVGYGITTTNMTGPARGTLVMVRKFDADRLNYVAQQTQLAITFEALSKSAAPPGITETNWARILSGAIITKPANDTVMTGATVITGIENKPSMILISVETSRPVYQQVQQSIIIVAVAIILLSIFLILVVQMLLQRFILAPLSTLDEDIKVIGKSGNISQSVVARGDDEIVSLAGSLNRMFKEIHIAHQRTFQSEAKFRALTENTPDIIFSANMDGTFTYISPQIEKYGFKVDEMTGTSGLPFVFPEDREPLLDSFKKGLEDGHRSSIHFRILDKWQNVHWLEVNYAMIMDSSGNYTGLHGMFRDITDRRQNLDAITLANKKLNLMYDITRHDILNKIAILFGLVDMTKASTSPDEREQFLNEIRNASDAIYRQIALTRNYQEVGVKSPQWNPVKEVIGRVVANFSGTGTEFKSDIENLEVYADPLIEKVIYNLVDNAIRYGKTITTISFSARPFENGIELICEDDGIGIDAGIKEKIFERGFGSNTGLGLFLAREILMITGITIQETGEPGKGARFVMFLPKGTYRFT